MRCGTHAGALASALAIMSADGAAQDQRTSSPHVQIVVSQDRLTIAVTDARLKTVLEAIAEQTGIRVLVDPSIGDAPCSLNVRDVTLDVALRYLAAPYDAFLLFEGQADGGSLLRTAWIVPRGSAGRTSPVPVAAERVDREAGLRHEDAEVRLDALQSMRSSGEPIDTVWLAELLVNDPSPAVRLFALQSLGDSVDAARLAEAALSDPHPHVRIEAQGVLARLRHRRHSR